MAELPVGTQLGPYRLEAVVARDRCGPVYRATAPEGGAAVAVRPLVPAAPGTPWFQDDIARALRPYAELRHPNLLPLAEVAVYDGTPVAVTPLTAGGTLGDRLGQPFGLGDALALLRPLAAALDALHERRLVHGDLRPANVLLRADSDLLLANAGIARALDSVARFGAPAGERTVEEAVYLAPEAAQGAPTDARADLYAFGVILYEALTGRPPFPGDAPGATAASIATQQATTLPPSARAINPQTAPEVEAILLRALAKSPYERYPSAAALCDALRDAGQHPEAADAASSGLLAAPVTPPMAPPAPRTTTDPEALAVERVRLVRALHAIALRRFGASLTIERQHLVTALRAHQRASPAPQRRTADAGRRAPRGRAIGQPQPTGAITFRVTPLVAARWALGKASPYLQGCIMAFAGLIFFEAATPRSAFGIVGLIALLILLGTTLAGMQTVTTIV